MKSQSQTKSQLIAELEQAKERVSALEQRLRAHSDLEGELGGFESDRQRQIAAHTGLHGLGLQLASELDLDCLLSAIVSRAAALVGQESGGVYLHEPERDLLRWAVSTGTNQVPAGNLVRRGEGLSGKVWDSGNPIMVADYGRWEGRAANPELLPWKAVLGVPLRWAQDFLGVLVVASESSSGFSPADTESLSLFAEQAALAMRNARLFNEAKQQLRDLGLLAEISSTVSASLDMEKILSTITQQIASVLDVEGCTVSTWDQGRNSVVTMFDYVTDPNGWQTEPVGTAHPLDVYPASRRVLTEGCSASLRISDPDLDPITLDWMNGEEIVSLLIVPMVTRGEAIGYLEIWEAKREREFTAAEIGLCETLANQAAAALENARLHGETERHLHEQIALHEASAAILSALDLETVLSRIAEQMAGLVDATSAYICSYDPEASESMVVAEFISPQASRLERESDLGASYEVDDTDFVARMQAGSHDSVDSRDPTLSIEERSHFEQFGAKTVLYVPLRFQEELIGYAELWESRRHREFTAREIALCQSIAQQAAIALENARLFEQAQHEIHERGQAEKRLRRRNVELSLLNRIIATSATQQSIEPILETVCHELAQAFNLPQVAAALFDGTTTNAKVAAECLAPGRRPLLGEIIGLADSPLVEWLFQHTAPVVVEDVDADARLAGLRGTLVLGGTQSILVIPLVMEGRVIGFLTMNSNKSKRFSVDEANLAWRVAEQASGSLTRVRLAEQRQRLEKQLRQAQKMEALGHLAGGVAHDFNNLLTVIRVTAQLMKRLMQPTDALWEHVSNLQDAGERAIELTGRLLSFSRTEVIEPRVVDLNEVVGHLQPLLRRLSGEKMEMETPLAQSLWPVKVDPGQMDHVLVNLVLNARSAMPRGGALIIETANVTLDEASVIAHTDAHTGDHVMLAVSDTGPGLDGEMLDHLFEPFHSRDDLVRGKGLGLATVYGITKQNWGHIRVYTEKGRGTTIRLYFPRAHKDQAHRSPARPVADQTRGGSETILLVEDEAAVRTLVAQLLEEQGYSVLTAGDGREGLSVSERHDGPLHLLLTDVIMPHMNGRELSDRLLAQRPKVRILFMSGYTDNVIARHGVLEPGIAFISKPLTVKSITRKVREILDSLPSEPF